MNPGPVPMISSLRLSYRFALLLLCCLSVPSVLALSEDRQKPLSITADQGSLDDVNRTLIYTGNVVVTQGTTEIRAERVTLVYDEKKNIDHLIAEGAPAQYREIQDRTNTEVTAKAKHMKYVPKTEYLYLTGDAKLWQGKDVLSGERVVYNAKRRLLTAEGDKKSKSRVEVTIQPQAQ